MNTHLNNVIVNAIASGYVVPQGWRVKLMNRAGVSVGEGTMVKSQSYFGAPGPITIGANCYISYRCDLDGTGPLTIGDDVYIAAGVSIGTCTHDIGPSHKRAGRQFPDGVSIGNGCWIGMNCTILPGVTIGPGCVIAAGAVVNHDCEPDGLYAGVPAKLVRDLESDERRIVRSAA